MAHLRKKRLMRAMKNLKEMSARLRAEKATTLKELASRQDERVKDWFASPTDDDVRLKRLKTLVLKNPKAMSARLITAVKIERAIATFPNEEKAN